MPDVPGCIWHVGWLTDILAFQLTASLASTYTEVSSPILLYSPLSLNHYLSVLQKPSRRFLRNFSQLLVFGGSLTLPLLSTYRVSGLNRSGIELLNLVQQLSGRFLQLLCTFPLISRQTAQSTYSSAICSKAWEDTVMGNVCELSYPSHQSHLGSLIPLCTVSRLRPNNPLPSPFDHLPNETICDIFVLLRRDLYANNTTDWISVIHVCHRWRDVALSCASFWANIDWTMRQPAREFFLVNAKGYPLNVMKRTRNSF